jgi:hypothetical protein
MYELTNTLLKQLEHENINSHSIPIDVESSMSSQTLVDQQMCMVKDKTQRVVREGVELKSRKGRAQAILRKGPVDMVRFI